MAKKFKETMNRILLTHNRSVRKERVEITLLYYGSVLANMANAKLYDKTFDEMKNINFYGMIFLQSGAGKDYAKNQTRKMFKDVLDGYTKTANAIKTAYIQNKSIDLQEEYYNKNIPDLEVSIESSDIGLYMVGSIINSIGWGSLNVSINEFGDKLGSTEQIDMLKEMYDGEIQAKIIQGDKDSEVRKSLHNLPVNLIAYGAPDKIKKDKKSLDKFKDFLHSGLFRRSLILYEEPYKTEKVTPSFEVDDEYIKEIKRLIGTKAIIVNNKGEVTGSKPYGMILSLSDEAEERLEEFEDEMIKAKNDDLYNELAALDEQSKFLIEKIAAIIAFMDLKEIVELEDVELAIDIFKRTRASIENLFNYIPPFEIVFRKLVSSKKPLTKTEIMKSTGLSARDIDFKEVKDEAYIHNYRLIETNTEPVKYSVEKLKQTSLNQIIVSINVEGKGAKGTIGLPFKIPLFGEGKTIESLLKQNKFDWFSFVHFKDNKRSSNNAIQGQNCIAFDIDEGMSLQEVKNILVQYTYLIYTTKSHGKEKGGKIADRFRIIIPTATMFYVDNERHKEMMKNLADKLELIDIDYATMNIDRLWFGSEDCEIYKNQGELLDVRCCLPDTTTDREVRENESNYNPDKYDLRLRMYIEKYFLLNYFEGNRNNTVFRMACFMFDQLEADINEVENNIISLVNSMSNPLPQREIDMAIQSAYKKCRR